MTKIYQSQSQNGISFLTVTPDHIFNLKELPLHHKDLFDRLLIAQAMTERLTIVTIDKTFSLYPIPTLLI